MADKSGFEIRADLLHLAYDIVQTNARMTYEASREVASIQDRSFQIAWKPFTVEDVVGTAEKLNEFVQRK